jgi:copper resistance protein B
MIIKYVCKLLSLTFIITQPVCATDDMSHDHGGSTFHMFRLETDTGKNTKSHSIQSWDLDGWVGTDENKLWLKSEGERSENDLESAELWVLYSRNIAPFWDAQVGVRYDAKPKSTAYVTLGINGLASYWFETEAHLFISNKGDISTRLRQENDLLLTQKLIMQPYIEVNLFAQDVPKQDVGRGISDGQIGLQTRYEYVKKFAPYIDFHYGQKFSKTASLAKNRNQDDNEYVGSVGLRVMF